MSNFINRRIQEKKELKNFLSHYANMPIQYAVTIFSCKSDKFQRKKDGKIPFFKKYQAIRAKIRILVSKGNSGVQMRRVQRSDVTTAPRACTYDVTLSKF